MITTTNEVIRLRKENRELREALEEVARDWDEITKIGLVIQSGYRARTIVRRVLAQTKPTKAALTT